MEAMAKRCDRILVMKEGRVAKIGTPEEIISRAEFLEDVSLDVPPSKRFLDALADDLPGLASFALDAKDTTEKILEATLISFLENNESVTATGVSYFQQTTPISPENKEPFSETERRLINHYHPPAESASYDRSGDTKSCEKKEESSHG